MRRLIIAIMALALTLGTTGSALAGSGEVHSPAERNASCVGISLSEHAQLGELPGEIKAAQAFTDQLGVNLGVLASSFAKIHAGTHAGCEAVLED